MSRSRDLSILAEYLSSLAAESLPVAVLRTAKACLLYGVAVGVATKHARPAQVALAAAKRSAETGTTTRFIDGAQTSHANALFANAVLLSGRVQGDSHPCGHIGGVVIPAAIAAAEQEDASGAALLSGLVAGYEAALRIGRDHAADLSLRGFRTTPCYGVFGSAVAAGRMRNFNPREMKNALAFAANFAGGLREYVDAGTEESPFHAGFAARNGLYATDVVACGLNAAESALHGSAGFYRAFGKDGIDYGARLTARLGADFEFTTVTYKQYPACQFLRGIIDGLANLRERAAGAAVGSIELRMNPYEADFIGVRFAGPYTSATQTVMSASFCAALAWVTGTASYKGMRNLDDPRVADIVARVKVIADRACECYEPYIRITLENGTTLEWQERAGDTNYRLTWETAVAMAYQLGREVQVPDEHIRALIDAVENIEREPHVRGFMQSLCAATAAAAS